MRERVPERLRVKREPQRAVYDRETIAAILDEALICHLGFEVDGQPYVIPTLHARVGDVLYVHGSAASRMLRHAAAGAPVCVTVTLLDGLVLARSVFNHSVNYRSAIVFGTATLAEGEEKLTALRALTEQLAPGRWDEARQPTDTELKATWILSLPLDEASAKVRTGPEEDEPEDLDLPVWAGVVPVHLAAEPSEYDWLRVRDGRLGPPHKGAASIRMRPDPRQRRLSE
jgi:nitroimidazol reductase NimA-like FMN-containing flavoprotein (pyridoxamine 5'-phosphate oxidase superfamily)